jgi:hypothetical protein
MPKFSALIEITSLHSIEVEAADPDEAHALVMVHPDFFPECSACDFDAYDGFISCISDENEVIVRTYEAAE